MTDDIKTETRTVEVPEGAVVQHMSGEVLYDLSEVFRQQVVNAIMATEGRQEFMAMASVTIDSVVVTALAFATRMESIIPAFDGRYFVARMLGGTGDDDDNLVESLSLPVAIMVRAFVERAKTGDPIPESAYEELRELKTTAGVIDSVGLTD